RELARRIAAANPAATDLEIAVIRAGESPGTHVVGFDAAGETIELRLTGRDRSAYAAGALAAADWLMAEPRPAGLHPFDHVAERGSRGRVRVVAGTGTNDTRATIAATRRAAALGADTALVVAPYYNRPDGRMLDAHFRAVADEGDLPIVVYNVPSRTGTNVDADTFLRLADHPRVIGVKEASGNLDQIAVICRDRPRDV